MFWLRRKRFSGSRVLFSSTSRFVSEVDLAVGSGHRSLLLEQRPDQLVGDAVRR